MREEHLQQTIYAAKNAFYHTEEGQPLTGFEFLRQQSHYIYKRWWIMQSLLLFVTGLLIVCAKSSFSIQRDLGITAPLFMLMIMPELWKNHRSDAMEVESASYFTLRQIFAARITLFAMVDLLLLTIFGGVVTHVLNMNVLDFVVQFFVPFNVSCCICFTAFYSRSGNSEVLALLLCGIWEIVWMWFARSIYEYVAAPVWYIMLLISTGYIVYCVARGQRNCDTIWEVCGQNS